MFLSLCQTTEADKFEDELKVINLEEKYDYPSAVVSCNQLSLTGVVKLTMCI